MGFKKIYNSGGETCFGSETQGRAWEYRARKLPEHIFKIFFIILFFLLIRHKEPRAWSTNQRFQRSSWWAQSRLYLDLFPFLAAIMLLLIITYNINRDVLFEFHLKFLDIQKIKNIYYLVG